MVTGSPSLPLVAPRSADAPVQGSALVDRAGASMHVAYISWAPHCSRSDHTARELGGVSHMVYWRALGSRVYTVWLKYLGQAWRTFRILSAERPDAVFVMAPPVFGVLAVWLWCSLRGVPYVVDAHTAAFLHPRWRYLQWLQDALCRRAVTTIVTNEHLAGRVRAAGGTATVVRDVPVEFASTDAFRPEGAFSVAVVCSFNSDEPLEEILEAAAALEDVRFYVTGNPKKFDRSRCPRLPPNVTLTGFLSTEAYGSLLANSHAVLTLTTRDHTMLRGAYEAVYQGTPVIVSDWALLREAFDRGAIHVNNTGEAIASALSAMRAQYPRYKADVMRLREQKYHEWREARSVLLAQLRTARAGRDSASGMRSSRVAHDRQP